MDTKKLRQKILDLAINGKLVEKEGVWEEVPLEDVLDYEQPQKYIVETTDYADFYDIPVLTAGKSFVIGYTNENKNVFNKVPVIIFDDFTTDCKYVDFPFKVKSSAMKILHLKGKNDLKYIYYFMSITKLIGKTHKRYWISEYSKLSIPLPPIAEQQRIVAKVEEWFALIDVLETSKENLQQSIAQAKNKILNLAINGKLVEKEGVWEEKTLGEVCSFESGLAYSSDKYTREGTPLIRISNITDGKISLENCVNINESDYTRHFYVEKGDLLIAMSGATTGKMGVYQNDTRAILNQRVGNIKIKDCSILCAGFRNLIMQGLKPIIEEIAYGGAQPNISSKMICALSIPLPSLAEQQRIVAKVEELFAELDNIAAAL